MADSDSGTHVTDISERLQDDFELRKEAMLQTVTEIGRNLSNETISQRNSIEISGEDISWKRSNSTPSGHQRRNSTGSTPRLIRHVSSRTTSPAPITQSRVSSPSRFSVTRAPGSAFHVPIQTPSPGRHVPHRVTSPPRLAPSHSVSPTRHLTNRLSNPARHPVTRGPSPAQLPSSRVNSPASRVPRRRAANAGRAVGRETTPRNNLVIANVHTTPRRYRKANGVVNSARHSAPNRVRQTAAQTSVSYGGALSEGDGAGFLRSLDSIPTHSGSRSAYDFVDASKRKPSKRQANATHVDITDIDLSALEEQEVVIDQVDDKPWLPTGIYAVFLLTLWTAVLRLSDGVEANGPVACSAGEETRLWICAASFSLAQGLAEAFWQRKNMFKVLFSMLCLFAYFIISHVQPLSCRFGEDRVTEISKWQSAMNFFVSALLVVGIYKHILETIQNQRIMKEKTIQKRQWEDTEDSEFEGLPEGII
ncbi:uncharacterized protein LOC111330174 [Stylophora pistillata]|uniref:uncharacterized protein LOC111330174 n=1 Tax=Stylophora pistillata TaxID=50429 RepID=UPI000C0446CB|nr:uncharacterized protein LOC111330174 [Stylophora pistillata]